LPFSHASHLKMARLPGIEFAGALYHVASRGDGRDDIYLDDTDREIYLEVVADVEYRYNWTIHAYCLMTNHLFSQRNAPSK